MASSSTLFNTSFLPSSRHLSAPHPPRFFLRFQKLPLHGTPPISSFSSQVKKPSTRHPHPNRSEPPPPPPQLDFRSEILRLHSLLSRIQAAGTLEQKVRVLDSDPRVRDGRIFRVLSFLDPYEQFLVKCMVAAGQGHVLVEVEEEVVVHEGSALKSAFYVLGSMVEKWSLNGGEGGGGLGIGGREELKNLIKTLDEMEEFYDCIGGIIG